MNVHEIFNKFNTTPDFTFQQFTTPTYSGGHNKWIVKYPKSGLILQALKKSFGSNEVDYNWIADYFGGCVAEFVTNTVQCEVNNLGRVRSIEWDTFVDRYGLDRNIHEKVYSTDTFDASTKVSGNFLFTDEIAHYRKPQIIDYCTASLNDTQYPLTSTAPQKLNPIISTNIGTLKEFLMTAASFRTVSKTQYNVFTSVPNYYNGGMFARNGNLKINEPEEVGQFVCQLSIDVANYTRSLIDIEKLWSWRTARNEKRSTLEDHFGYDTKHASHLVRLLIGAKNILTTGEYHPRLTGDNLKTVTDVLNGKKTYDWVIAESSKMDAELEELYKTTTLPKTANHKKANDLLLELSREC